MIVYWTPSVVYVNCYYIYACMKFDSISRFFLLLTDARACVLQSRV
jgi:hypothetical protein